MKRWFALIAAFSLVPAARAEVVVGGFDPASTARIFAPTAQGDVAPVRTVGGALTQLQNVTSFALDGTRSELYIGDFNGQAIRVFDVRATGNRAPTRTITSNNMGQPREIALDLVHDELLGIAQLAFVCTWPRGANGLTPATRCINWGGLPGSVTLIDNPSGLVYLPVPDQVAIGDFQQTGSDPAIAEVLFYPRTAAGNVAPTRALRGAATQLGSFVESLAFDAGRNELYVLAIQQGSPNVRRVVVFSGDASGDAAPLRVIEGDLTQIQGQSALAIDPRAGLLWVVTNGDRLLAFPRLAAGNAAPVRVVTGPQTGLANAFGAGVIDLDPLFANGFE